VERVFNPDRKETRWGKRKLKKISDDRLDLREYQQAGRRPPTNRNQLQQPDLDGSL
jgi:hypothetical protein